MRYIGLVDCNNFFVSCERLFRPDLRTQPTVVLSSNDGCVVARSQEVKDMGIPMGVPYWQVKDTLKQHNTAIFSTQFTLYRDISRRVFSVLRSEVACMEQYSIDEAFFIYEGTAPEAFAQRLKQKLEQAVGIPVSIGMAASKTQAKYAAAYAKRRGGVCVLDQARWQVQADSLLLRDIWGVGAGRARAFAAHNLKTVADLLVVDTRQVSSLFGVEGVRLQHELAGRAVLTVAPRRPAQKSIMSSRSFRTSSTNQAVIADALAYHVRHAVADLRSQGQVADTLQISIRPSRFGDFALRGGSASCVLPVPSDDTTAFLQQATHLLGQLYQAGVPYQKVGCVLLGLRPASGQVSLFAEFSTTERQSVMLAMDKLNQRFGDDTVRLGSGLQEGVWQSKRASLSPAYTTRWADIPMVQTQPSVKT